MTDTLKKAEELIKKIRSEDYDCGFFKIMPSQSNSNVYSYELKSLISDLIEENERLNKILELHAHVLTIKHQRRSITEGKDSE